MLRASYDGGGTFSPAGVVCAWSRSPPVSSSANSKPAGLSSLRIIASLPSPFTIHVSLITFRPGTALSFQIKA
jgi:hypothetical protein